MIILPAIDMIGGKAVRLFKGDFSEMKVYNEDPVSVALSFVRSGASHVHMVDLDGAREGQVTSNSDVVRRIKEGTSLFVEVGGGIRSEKAVRTYLEDIGADRVILGTRALEDLSFVRDLILTYGERIAVGVDIRDGKVSVRGWKEDSGTDVMGFLSDLQETGVRTVIVTDISKDGTLAGSNRELYRTIKDGFGFDLIASGGVSGIDDIRALKCQGLHGAIIGKAYYEGRISIEEALEAAR